MIYAVLRIISEPPWRLTFWTFHLWVCDVTLPQALPPQVGKTKRTLHLCLGIRILDIHAFHYHKTHKNNSNHVAVLVFTCCAAPISLRVVDILHHTHAFSRVTLREFFVKWATMAAPMVSENVRFKINL